MSLPPGGPDLASLSSLDDPVRRRLYEVVIRQPGPVNRDEAASAAGVGRALAVYHLDKLVESGLLAASYQRPPGRSGPGAGRPAKLYSRSDREFAVTVPPREYELAARLLVQVVADDPSGRSRAALGEAARRLGAELGGTFGPAEDGHGPAAVGAGGPGPAAVGAGGPGPAAVGAGGPGEASGVEPEGGDAAARDVKAVLAQQGYEPVRGSGGVIRLRNCPFHQLAESHRDVVCGMNLALVEGLVTGLGADGWRPVLDPQPGHCCVAIGGDRP
jgi:predicted ArsR family transcriptional regulator